MFSTRIGDSVFSRPMSIALRGDTAFILDMEDAQGIASVSPDGIVRRRARLSTGSSNFDLVVLDTGFVVASITNLGVFACLSG